MAKGDHQRLEDEIKYQKPRLETSQGAMMDTLNKSNQGFQNNYNTGVGMNIGSYNDIMKGYQDIYNGVGSGSGGGGGGGGVPMGAGSAYGLYSNLANNGGGYGWDTGFRGAVDKSLAGFGNFADTGGFTDQGIQDIRARDTAPARAVFARSMEEAKRQGRLQPFSPNMNSALSRMARDSAIAVGDINTNANAGIAQMVQQGKLAGLQGLGQTGIGAQGASTNIDQLNAQMKLAGLSGMSSIDASNAARASAAGQADIGNRMDALGGMRQLYGTTPGMAETFGNQLLTSNNQLMTGTEMGHQLGGNMIGAYANLGQTPGNFQSIMSPITDMIGAGGQLVGGLVGMGGLGGGGNNVGNMQNPWQGWQSGQMNLPPGVDPRYGSGRAPSDMVR